MHRDLPWSTATRGISFGSFFSTRGNKHGFPATSCGMVAAESDGIPFRAVERAAMWIPSRRDLYFQQKAQSIYRSGACLLLRLPHWSRSRSLPTTPEIEKTLWPQAAPHLIRSRTGTRAMGQHGTRGAGLHFSWQSVSFHATYRGVSAEGAPLHPARARLGMAALEW